MLDTIIGNIESVITELEKLKKEYLNDNTHTVVEVLKLDNAISNQHLSIRKLEELKKMD